MKTNNQRSRRAADPGAESRNEKRIDRTKSATGQSRGNFTSKGNRNTDAYNKGNSDKQRRGADRRTDENEKTFRTTPDRREGRNNFSSPTNERDSRNRFSEKRNTRKDFFSDRNERPTKRISFDGDNNDRKSFSPDNRRFSRGGNSEDKPFRNNDRDKNRPPFGRTRKEFSDRDDNKRHFDGNNDRKSFSPDDRRFSRGGNSEGRPLRDNDRDKNHPSFGRTRKEFSDRDDDRQRPPFDKPVMKRDADYNPHAKYSLRKQIEYKRQTLRMSDSVRLNRFLANAGICSRREADEFIKAGVVTVNGQIVTEMGTKISPKDKVMFHDQLVRSEKKVYILINKPKDCVTTSEDPQDRFTVMDLIKDACSERVYPVGRLDRNTTGVLLLTNDGDLAAKLTHPKYNKKKIYHVFLDKPLTKANMEEIAQGIKLEDGEIHADKISYVDETDKKQVGIEIHSGRNRIVRRIFEHFGYKVEKLDRVYFAGLTKKNLPRGKYRLLTEKEVGMLNMGAYE